MIERLRMTVGWLSFALALAWGWLVYLTTRSAERARQAVADAMAGSVSRVAGLRVHLYGLEHLDGLGPAVFVANHQSHVDQVIMAHLYRKAGHLTIVAKLQGLWDAPPLAALYRLTGNIALRESRTVGNAGAVRRAVHTLGQGGRLGLYPEGSRQRDGRTLGVFQPGAFLIAIRAQVPVVPVVMSRQLPDIDLKAGRLAPHVSHVRILEPVSTRGLDRADAEGLRAEVHRRMQEVLDRDAAEGPGPV